MRLADFIVRHLEVIVSSWVVKLRPIAPGGEALEDAALRDDAHAVLVSVVRSMRSDDDGRQASDELSEAARTHASVRVAQGFSLDQMMSEYRALRSDVLHRWTLQVDEFDRETHDDHLRFNHLLDQAVAASTAHYAKRLELARDLFLGVLGHDLRTPLAAVAHSTALLGRNDATDEQRGEALDRISKSARRMDLMIQDLLDLTRTRLGTQLPMSPMPCDLEEIARQALDELSAFHPTTAIVFNASGDLKGSWDCDRVMQLLSNLVDNAIRHRTGDEPVTVELRGEDDRATISVHNVGQVIPPAEQKAIFDPLRRGMHQDHAQPPPGGTAGLGIGLYIAQQIAAAHGGGIQVSSTQTEGTRFVAVLARHRAE